MCVSQQRLCIAIETQQLIPSRCKSSRLRPSPDVKRRQLMCCHSKDNSSNLISLLLSCTFLNFSLSRVEKEPLDPREMMESQVTLDQMWVALDEFVLITLNHCLFFLFSSLAVYKFFPEKSKFFIAYISPFSCFPFILTCFSWNSSLLKECSGFHTS